MRNVVAVLGILLIAGAAGAELQSVEVSGEIHLRGRYWRSVYSHGINGPAQIRIPGFFLPGRSIGPFGTASRYDFDDDGEDLRFVEMRTRLGADARFTREVRAFVELESYDRWGTDFRSNYLTGTDLAAFSANDVEVYQAFAEANTLWGTPFRLRVGRQEMQLGKGWVVDDITTAIIGRSWDMVRLTYDSSDLQTDMWASKLAENSPIEEDGDVDFYGLYATWGPYEAVNIAPYWMLIRDARALNDTNFVFPAESIEDVLGIDDYDATLMHTAGMRIHGGYGPWDYDLELAYQWGDADAVGFGFKPYGTYGDASAEYDSGAGDLEVGYTADVAWQPRLFVGGAYFEGEDNRDLSFAEWLSPFDQPKASVSFNRLFPGTPYSPVLEIGQDMSNFWQVRAGVAVHPTEKLSGGMKVAYYEADEPFDWPRHFTVANYRIPIAPNLSFWTQESESTLGTTAGVWGQYAYSEDLQFRLVWEHLFTGKGLEEGNFLHRYGLQFSGGTSDDDADYIHVESRLRF